MCWDLRAAILQDDLGRARELLDNGSSVNEEESSFYLLGYDPLTPLQFAHRSVKITRLLLDRGASLISSEDPKTALHLASENGCIQVVRLYLDIGTEVDLRGDDRSPLFYASKGGSLEVARLLLDRGADADLIVLSEGGFNGSGPLHVACSNGILAIGHGEAVPRSRCRCQCRE